MTAKIIAVANQKGGVCKTTTAISTAYHFAANGRRVLVVDFDVQGQVSTFLGIKKANGLYRLMADEEPVKQVVINARPNLDIIPNDKSNEKLTAYMLQATFREYAVAKGLETAEGYDLVFLDMPPSSNILHIAALVASDYVIIPTLADFASLEGVTEEIATIRSLGRIPGVRPPQLIGILPTKYELTTGETKENIRRLQRAIGSEQILPPIPTDVHVREANARGLTIWEYDPDSRAAVGYDNGSPVRNSKGKIGGYLHLVEIVGGLIRQRKE